MEQEIKKFLQKNEWQHTSLSARLQRGPFNSLSRGLWLSRSENALDGLVYISPQGTVYPAHRPRPGDRQLKGLLKSCRKNLFSVTGTEERVTHLESMLSRSPVDAVNYRMLTRPALPRAASEIIPQITPKITGRLTLRRAAPEDMERLWPLEKAYLQEEVLRKGRTTDERLGQKMLALSLKQHIVVTAELNGRPVAKAATNARGMAWDQIGGVYVRPELRGRQLGKLVVLTLLDLISAEGKNACLFVKTANQAALALYRSTGFQDRCGFRIAYWQ